MALVVVWVVLVVEVRTICVSERGCGTVPTTLGWDQTCWPVSYTHRSLR